jgi:hydroxypyruvate isomerase
MPKFCANLTMLFTEYPLLERPMAAANAGFDAVEILFPYDENAADLDTALARAKMRAPCLLKTCAGLLRLRRNKSLRLNRSMASTCPGIF